MRTSTDTTTRWRAIAAELVARALWLPLAVLLLHAVISLGFDGYDRLPGLDVPVHLLGGAVIAATFERTLAAARRHHLIEPVEQRVAVPLLLGLTSTAALAWECAEFLSDRYLATGAQRGLADTLGDMLVGVAGAALFLIGCRLRARRLG